MSQHPLENVIKQGYLKKGNTGGNRLSGLLRKIEGQKWFVFTVRDSIPYLEYYDSETELFSQRPVNSYCLSRCYNVSSMGRSNPPTFTIVCSDRLIELIASTRPHMLEWVHDIETSLTRLGILKKEKVEHVYSICPAVVRQPRVSQDVLEERAVMQHIDYSTQFGDTNGASVQQSNSSQDEQPPPLPNRPPPLVPRTSVRTRLPETASSSHFDHTTDLLETLGAEADDGLHCSNDSDFVSWDVVMRVRESYLQKSEEEQKSLENSCRDSQDSRNSEDLQCAGAAARFPEEKPERISETSNSVFEETFGKSKGNSLSESEDVLDLTILPACNLSSAFPSVGSESDLSVNMDHISRKSTVEENEYSLLPDVLKDREQDKFIPKQYVKTVKPVPLPRQAFFLRNDSGGTVNGLESTNNSHHLEEQTEIRGRTEFESLEIANGIPFSDKENQTALNRNRTDLDHDDENASQASEKKKDENANFYDSKNSASHCVLAPPTIPPRCDSLSGWTSTIVSSQDCSNGAIHSNSIPNVNSHPVSSSTIQSFTPTSPHSSKIMSIPSTDYSLSSLPHKEGAFASNVNPSQDIPTIPPLPLPRRKTTKATTSSPHAAFQIQTHASTSDVPPLLPRRSLPKSVSLPFGDIPPELPSRNAKPVSMMKSKLGASYSFAESDEKTKLLDDRASVASSISISEREKKATTIGATPGPGSRVSGLSKKMLLDRANSLHTVVSLKQTQAEILQVEIDMRHVSVTLTQKSGHGLALVDWNGQPCVAGWNQKDFPSLHGKLHIGDLLISVNHVRVTSCDSAQKLLRHAPEAKIEVVLQRMPYAKVFAIRRSAEGQSLGLKRNGGTAEILYVDPNGLAAEHGLPQYAPGTMGKSRCNWFLSEINSRPLNLFFKESEIEHLLYAVGREISIVVQPSDFIFEIRKGLKKLKNYKNFITQ